jgi:hypothetical protein
VLGCPHAKQAALGHAFDRVLDTTTPSCYTSYRRSIEHSFDHRGTAGRRGAMSAITIHEMPVRRTAPAQDAVVIPFPVDRVRGGHRPGRGGSVPAALQLTRRGRLVVRLGSLVALTCFLAVVVLLQSGTAGATGEVGRVPLTYRAVLPGETLWSIAGEVAPDVDRRETIARIVELNALESSGVRAGQRIAVPASATP